jgi:hypothetical protein
MNQKTTVGIIVIALALSGAAAYFFLPRSNTPAQSSSEQQRPLKTFYSEKYGIAFNYPDNYAVKEQDVTGEGTPRHTIVVADAAALASAPEASEAPPSITIDIFPNSQNQTVEKWIKGSNFSNYKLSPDGKLSATSIAGEQAMAYAWDGLYPSTSIVFSHKKQIFMISVGQNAPTDQIVKDFPGVVASIQFDP